MNNHADTHLLMPTAYPDCGLDIHNIYTLNKLNATPGCMCMLYIRHISLDILDVPDILDAFDKGSPFLKFVVSIWALPKFHLLFDIAKMSCKVHGTIKFNITFLFKHIFSVILCLEFHYCY